VSVVVRIPTPLRPLADGQPSVVLDPPPRTLAGVLGALWTLHPLLRERVVDERGHVRPHVNLFVGAENARDGAGLATAIADGSEIAIIAAVSGGL
jgi:sulfur-carrier protein